MARGGGAVMARPGDEVAANRGHLRASHAERDQLSGTLETALGKGLLNKTEFGLRVGQALAARTYADLAALTADLPAGLRAAPPPWPWPTRARLQPSGLRPRRWIAI